MFKPFGLFLLSLFLFTQVYNTAVWMNYEMNVEEITNLFCENTDKPEMNCHGICHLKKQVLSNDQENPVESNTQLYINEIQLFSTKDNLAILALNEDIVTHSFYESNLYSFLNGKGLFHPPQV